MSTPKRSGQIGMAQKDHFNLVVGEALRAARQSAGMSMDRLAAVSRLPFACIQTAEAGNGVPAYALAYIAEALDCRLDDLVPTEATQ